MCKHIVSNCQIYCKTCNEHYDCRICHDDLFHNHIFSVRDCNRIKCKICLTSQTISNKCYNCNVLFAEYHCLKCLYFNNIICYHCDECQVCYFQKKHICLVENICILCSLKFEHSIDLCKTHCGHIVHLLCLKELIFDDYSCPLCHLYSPKNNNCNLCFKKLIDHNGRNISIKLPCNHILHYKCSITCSSFVTPNQIITPTDILSIQKQNIQVNQIITCPTCFKKYIY